MKAWHRYAWAFLPLVAVVSGTRAGAQSGNTQTIRAGQIAGPKFLVSVLHSSDKTLGVQGADEIRSRLMGDFLGTQLWIVPKNDIDASLAASGYSTTEALTPNDLRVLAPQVRAEEYLDGTITREASGFTLRATLNLVRPAGMVQPLPDITDPKLGGIAKGVSVEIDKARKQMKGTKDCLAAASQKKYDEAMAAAQKGVVAYPRATLARVCMLEVAYQAKMGPDSIIRIAEEILKIYPANARALQLVTDAYGEKHMDDKYIASMLNMLKADPTNSDQAEKVVRELSRLKKFEVAKTIVDEAVKQSPGDVNLIRLQLQVYRGKQNWKDAAIVAEELIKVDTAVADTTFFQQLVGAYVADSQIQKAAEAAARGANKFPKSATLWLTYAQLSRQTGQAPQALQAINRVLAIDPKYPQANLLKVTILRETNQTDSVMAAIRGAVAAGEDKAQMGAVALVAANALYGAYARDSLKTLEGGARVLAVLAWVDSLSPSPTASLLMGATDLNIAIIHITKAAAARSCDDTKSARDALTEAQTLIQKGGRGNPQLAGNLMNTILQLQTNVDSYWKGFKCK